MKLQERFIAATTQKVLGNPEKAETLLRVLAADAPQNPEIHFQWATVLYTLKQLPKAIDEAKAAYTLEPANRYYGEFYAERLNDKAEFKAAAIVYQNLAKAQPNTLKHLYLLQGLMWTKANDPDNAIKAFNALEEKIGVNEETTNRKYILYAAQGKKDKAVAELRKLITAFPQTMEYRHDLAGYYQSIGQPAKALEVQQEILKLSPSDGKAMIALASNAGQNGDEVQFVRSLKGLFSRTDVTVDTKIKQLLPYLQTAKPNPAVATEALACAEILANTHPKDAQALSFYADLLYKNGKPNEAIAQYRLSANADKNRFYPWQYILIILTEQRNFEELLRQSAAAIEYFPSQPLPYYMNGVANYQKKQYAAAIDMLLQTLPMLAQKSTMLQDVQHQLARSYMALAQYDKAQQAFDEALRNGGDKDAGVQEHYGDYLAGQGKTDDAVRSWQVAKQLGSPSETLARKITARKFVE